MTYEEWRSRITGNAFDDEDVARSYAQRPPYAPALFDFLLGLVPERRCLVDLGCGPGKVAAALANNFEDAIALDPSGPMIDEAHRLYAARHPNIRWLHASAEDAELPARIDLVTAGTAIHWMKHDVLFPKLAERTPLVAVLNVKAPPSQPWADAHRAFMTDWLAHIGETYDEKAFDAKNHIFETWLDIGGRRTFPSRFRQSLADFATSLHSTATFSRSRMGEDLATKFDEILQTKIKPWCPDGFLTLDLESELVWGAPRRTPKS